MSEHTPGPWDIRERTGDGKAIIIMGDGDGWHRLECEVSSDDCDRDGAEANARLIAAAPALLAACKLWDEGFVDGQEFDQAEFMTWLNGNRRAAREAVALATGGEIK